MAKFGKSPLPASPGNSGMRGSPFFQPGPEKVRGTTSLGPDLGTRRPATREPLARPAAQTGSTSIKPEPVRPRGSVSLGPDPARAVPATGVGKPTAPAKQPISGPTAFEPPAALKRPHNGETTGDGFKIDHTRGRDGGGLVDDPFTPAWDK